MTRSSRSGKQILGAADIDMMSVAGRVIGSCQPCWISTPAAGRLDLGSAAADAGLRTGFGFPVTLGSELLAVVESEPTRCSTSTIACLRPAVSGALQLGRVVERARACDAASPTRPCTTSLTDLPNRALF